MNQDKEETEAEGMIRRLANIRDILCINYSRRKRPLTNEQFDKLFDLFADLENYTFKISSLVLQAKISVLDKEVYTKARILGDLIQDTEDMKKREERRLRNHTKS